ncbi:plasmid partitioning protein RepB [Pseudoroseomonas rhizosphaerae]|uniref:Plasmid partitioning protein RepB n=1 Tax=Teichococcus rhizosphaerae TaxID=1335062 RepID=A0A2C6Z5Y7_9PROT|nr:plasmid partitioning protein RepB [Pseudoroseomonas rhizosphaerae]PHK93901.1 plasmid partitioning protein RepB [Pseudoroseomonas rhizosphaerae]
MKRKNTLRDLLSTGAAGEPPAQPGTARVPSGAVRAMGLSLGHLRDEAQALRASIEAGDTVVELDPAQVEGSFVSDRLASDNEGELRELVQSIAESGQQVPVLVRPHPEKAGHYQIAYGHRRLIAVRRLGGRLKAVIRALSDAELVVAQGKENIERRNLTFIERALFAAHLEAHGFDRPTLHAALAVQSAEMTRYLQVARAIPRPVILAIGPAPRTGRPRWLELQRLFAQPEAAAMAERAMTSPGFRALNSDARFQRVFEALRHGGAAPETGRYWRNPQGDPVVRIEQGAQGLRLTINERLEPEFGAYVADQLEPLYQAFLASREGRKPR